MRLRIDAGSLSDPMPLDSPRPVERFFGADARGDIDAIVALFTDDAVVVDERQTCLLYTSDAADE